MGTVIHKSRMFFRRGAILKKIRCMIDFAFERAADPAVRAVKTTFMWEFEGDDINLFPLVAAQIDPAFCRRIGEDLDAMSVEDEERFRQEAYMRLQHWLGVRWHCLRSYRESLPGRSAEERHRLLMPCFERFAVAWLRATSPQEFVQPQFHKRF